LSIHFIWKQDGVRELEAGREQGGEAGEKFEVGIEEEKTAGPGFPNASTDLISAI
jgi:hypothetical protein